MKVRLTVILFLLSLGFYVSSRTAYAEEIQSFNTDIVAHKDGNMSVRESIQYDFENEERHGIYRFIPLYSKVGDLYRVIKISNIKVLRDGKKEKFGSTKNKEQVNIKVGNADKTISGVHFYEISYEVENGIGSNYSDHDEIYWNATGNGWEVPIESASAHVVTDFGVGTDQIVCFTRNANFNAQFCKFDNQIVQTTGSIHPGEGLTVVYRYPEGTFPKSILLKELPKTSGEKIGEFLLRNYKYIWLGINILLPILLIFWYQNKKNKTRFGSPAVNFDIPKDENGARLAPAIAGTIDTAKLERDDVVATLFDLAIRKYILLSEEKTQKKLGILGKGAKQKIKKLKISDSGLNPYEAKLFGRLFESSDEIYADDLKKDFYKTFSGMESDVFKILVNKKYYVRNPKLQRSFLSVFGTIALFTVNIILSTVLFILAKKLIGRTALGDEIDHKIDGLKLFLKSMDRNYDWQAKNFLTVEQMIPYAMSLGYMDEFMDQLKIMKPDYNPVWYHGYSGNFYHSYGGFYSSMSSNMTTSAPFSSSGFSGGSSGGGGGGGGGGSW